MDVGMLSLKWENHSWTFSQALLNIRNREVYCDATIACEGKFYKVHKLILSACSKYMEQLFDKANLCCPLLAHPVIFLQDIRHEHLEALLDYMYVGEVNVKQTDLPLLIKAAECLQIKGLAVPDDLSTEKKSDKIMNNRNYNFDKSEEKSLKSYRRETIPERIEVERTKRQHSEDNERDMLKGCVSPSNELNGINKKRLRTDNYFQENSLSNLEVRNIKIKSKENDDSQCLESSLDHTEVKLEPQSEYNEYQYINSNELSFEPKFELNNQSSLQENAQLDINNITQSHVTHQSYSGTRSATDNQVTPVFSDSQISTWESHEQSQEEIKMSNSSTFLTAQQHTSSSTDINDFWQQAIQTTPAGVSCPFCSKVYTNRSAFRYHYKTHTGEKPYACPHCPQRFILRGDMMKHVKTHTGEKPFSCPHCPHTFIQKSNMKDHIFRHHPEANMPAPKRCIVMNAKS
ncbi:unnamed protein product [Meganyctiphanes norvegica]|uniref:Uncharacterized protein n=1 Tax=Meganyctiphanes norvegica TaxID=48144 RepID=A0AAV2SQQ8_MEGNR